MAPQEKSQQVKWTVAMAAVLAFVGYLSSDMYLPMMPAMARDLHTTNNLMQLSVGIFMVSLCVAQLVLGIWSDRIGRRPIFLWGIVFMMLGSVVCACSQNIIVFLSGRVLVGVGSAGGLAMARIVVRDCYSGVKLAQIVSVLSLVVGIAPTLAPVLGAFIGQHAGWRFIFEAMVAAYALAWLVFWFRFSETLVLGDEPLPPVGKMLVTGIKKLATAREYLCGSGMTALLFAAYMACVTAAPFLFQQRFAYSLKDYTVVVIGMVAASFLGRACNFMLLRVWRVNQVIMLGLMLVCVSMLVWLMQGYVVESALWSLIWILVFVMGCGMIFGNVFVIAMNRMDNSVVGLGGAMYGAMQMTGASLGSLMAAWMPEHSIFPLGSLMLLGSLLAAMLFWLTFYHRPAP